MGKLFLRHKKSDIQEKKHDASFPSNAVKAAFSYKNITIKDINLVVFYEKPFLKFERLLQTYLHYVPKGLMSFMKAMPIWMKQKLWMKADIINQLKYDGEVIFTSHHESHAASAFYPSPYKDAAIITIDGVGEWTTTSYGVGEGKNIKILEELHFPHSLGLLYSAVTYFLGFKVNSGEYKVMGLAPYGEPKYTDLIRRHLIDLKEDGSFRLNMKYFSYGYGLKMTNWMFERLFKLKRRKPESELLQCHMDVAASIQVIVEEVVLKIARHVRKVTHKKYLCLAGGVALNCVANGKIMKEKIFEHIWTQPAAGDAGGALGAALAGWHMYKKQDRHVLLSDSQKGSYLGDDISEADAIHSLDKLNATYVRLSESDLLREVATYISKEAVVGWVQGRMEFGPRALGARSILGDARSENMQRVMNLKIKFRESFRPFAPLVLKEKSQEYFDINQESPYMLLVSKVKESIRYYSNKIGSNLKGLDKLNFKRSTIPAVTHVDYSARVQTVDNEKNPKLHQLLDLFQEMQGCSVIINTSFNVRGEPIVRTVEDAYRCFMRTHMDVLVIDNILLLKSDQPDFKESLEWKKEYELD